MLMQFNDNKSNEYGDAQLIRKDSIVNFKYQQLEGRSYRFNDPIQGYINVKASQSIKTTEDLNYVMGDKIKLDIYEAPLRIANMSKKVNAKQLMYLEKDYSVEYILDLE